MKETNTIIFRGPTCCGKSTYINKVFDVLAKHDYSVECRHGTLKQFPALLKKECKRRFLLIHELGSADTNLCDMQIEFIRKGGAMDLFLALCGDADPEKFGFMKTDPPLECEDCKSKGADVKKKNCPFAEEINGRKIEVQLCDDCYNERLAYI